ncbi:MAG TPA: carboxypeptidase-like regulatory domain-containing protein, partial [Geobacteraceae bacterium]
MKRHSAFKWCSSVFALVSMFMLLFGCSGNTGAPGTSTGTLKGTVTSSLTNVPVAGATVTTSPAIQAAPAITTDTNGNFSASVPIGSYQITVAKTGYTSQTATVSVASGQATTNNMALVPTTTAAVSVANVTAAAGATATLTAVPSIADGISGTPAYTW